MSAKQRSCFVISPIGQADSQVRHHANDVYRFIIKPALEQFHIKPERSDEIPEAGRISIQMFKRIFHADVCMVVLTGHNPNVFYELAVAQCAARPTVLLIEKGQDLPFDIKDLRTVVYEMLPISRLVDGHYAKAVVKQLKQLAAQNWNVSGLFEQYHFAPKLQTEQQVRRLLEEARPMSLPAKVGSRFALPFDPERRITIATGDIIELADSGILAELGVDVIVSLENTYLQLDTFFSLSMSGKLRYLDSDRSAGRRITRDSLAHELERQIRARNIVLPASIGTTIPTPTNHLADHGVKAVFHVAGLQGTLGDGYKLPDKAIDDCVRDVFDTFAKSAEERGLKTIMLPMLGSFMTNLDQNEVVRLILRAALAKMPKIPACREIVLLAWIESQSTAIHRVAGEFGLEEIIAPETGEGPKPTETG